MGGSTVRGIRRRIWPLIAVLAGAGLTVTAAPAQAGGTPPSAPAPTSLSSSFYGVNYDDAGAAEFRNANVGPLLKQLDPGTLRYPGGTEADFFNWHTGDSTKNPRGYPFTLSVLEKAYQATGAAPVFDLNVLAPGNRQNTTDQVMMLKKAKSLGLPVKYVEIGNELYGGVGQQAFRDGAAYGKTVALYVKALHQDFPGVKVAADAMVDPSGPRQQQWNSQLLHTATGDGAPDGLILHYYPGTTYNPFTAADLPPLFAGPYTAISHLTQVIKTLDGRPVWLTEYNFRGKWVPKGQRKPNPVQTSYARELYLAAYALMLPRVPRIVMVDNWSALAGGKSFSAWANPRDPQQSPGGQAVAMIDAAAYGAQSTAPITIPDAPTLPGGGAAVLGQAFLRSGKGTTAVLVNLTGSQRSVPVGPYVRDGDRFQRAAGQPTAQQALAKPLTSGTVTGAQFQLPPYSITLVNTTVGGR
jgi:hypothetical protein